MNNTRQITWRFNESRGPLAYYSDQDPFHLWVYPDFVTCDEERSKLWTVEIYKVLPSFDCVKIYTARYDNQAEAMIAGYREWEARR